MSVRIDEICGRPIAAKIAGSLGMVHADGEILVHFEVEMGRVHAVVIAHRADLLSSPDLLPLMHENPVEVAVEGIGEMKLPVLDPCMADDDDITPVGMDIAGQHHHPISDGMNRTPESLGAATLCDPILSKMASATEPTGFHISLGIGRGHGKVESVCRARRGMGRGGRDGRDLIRGSTSRENKSCRKKQSNRMENSGHEGCRECDCGN